jgi:MFS family permease
VAVVAKPWRTFFMVSIGVFASLLDLLIVNVAFPDIGREFAGTELRVLSWVLSGYAIGFAALLVPAGRLADLYGRKRGYVVGLSLFTLASAACAAAPLQMFQQVGAGLGVALFVAIVGTPAPAAAVAAFRDGWSMMAVAAVAGSLLILLAGRLPAPSRVAPASLRR